MSLSRPLYDTLYRSIVKTFTEAGGYGLLDSFGSNNASAAYSLRSLRDGYIGPVVRVRRSGDNAERDFSHGQIDNGVLTNWVNQLSAFDPEVATDLTDQALAAHSLRDLTGLSRPVVRLRRASDNAESDFTAADLVGSVEGSELVTNGGFDTDSDWSKGAGWTISGGQASNDGSQAGYTYLSQNGVMDFDTNFEVGDYYILEFTIVAASTFTQTGVIINTVGVTSFSGAFGITSAGTYRILGRYGDLAFSNVFRFYTLNNNTLTIDNVSCKPYTPTEAELWACSLNTNDKGSTSTDSAYVTTWYDQSASNEQVYPNSGGVIDASEWTGQTTGNQIVLDKSGGYMSSNHIVGIDTYLEDGKTYKVSFNYVNTGNSADWYTGFPGGQLVALPAGSGEFEFILTRNGSDGYLRFQTNGSFAEPVTLTITGPISITEIGNLATQTTSNNQPKLIKAGVTNTVDNKPAILFNDDESSVRTWLDLSYFPAGGNLDSYYVVKPTDSVYLFPNGTSYYGPVYQNNGVSIVHLNFANSNFKFYVNGRYIEFTTRQKYYQAISPNQHHLAVHQDHKGDGTVTNFGIYSSDAVTVYNFNGSAQEILVYDTSQLANRTKIERNINRYYNLWYEENTKLIGDTTSPTAAAAYSLRSLDGDATANVVRLRRVSDNEERDFTAADLVGSVEGGELVDNSNWTTTGSSTHWTINGSLLSIDGTQTSQAVIRQDGIIEAKQYVLSFDVTCNDYSDLWIQYLGSSASRFYANELGITTDGSYSLLLDLRGRDNPMFRFYVKQSGTQATLDNVSLKEYTPSVAEEWSWVPTWRVYTRQVYDTAFVTTLYDQTASNNQVLGDPAIQSPGDWTAHQYASVSQGLISIENATEPFRVTYNGGNIQPGTYILEVDYYGVTQANRIVIETLILPVGSGTASKIITVESSNALIVGGYGALFDRPTGYITGIRLIDIGNTATQSTSTAQPKLITAGVTELENGKPAMVFDGSDDYLDISTNPLTVLDNLMVAVVTKPLGTNAEYGVTLSEPAQRIYVPYLTTGNMYIAYDDSATKLGDGAITNDQQLLTLSVDASTASGFKNGAAFSVTPTGTADSGAIIEGTSVPQIGAYNGASNWNGTFQEILIYDSDQTFNREAIEDNINDYYSIYDTPAYDGFVTTWYDQSKNSNHATQSTFTSQPKIVSAGVLLTDNGKPAIVFDGVDDVLENALSGGDIETPLTIAAVYNKDVASSNYHVFDGDTLDRSSLYVANSAAGTRLYNNGSGITATSAVTADQVLVYAVSNGASSLINENGNTPVTGTIGTLALDGITIGRAGQAINYLDSKIQEVIVYDSDQSANRRNIETNINNHYNIY